MKNFLKENIEIKKIMNLDRKLFIEALENIEFDYKNSIIFVQ